MKKRVFSGIQPSGEIHVGNYIGAIQNWVKLMDDYDCIFCIVDYHAMTKRYDPANLQRRILDAAIVNIACGLDPDRCSIFVQSRIVEHAELAWIFNCITPYGELQRMTQFKEKSKHQHKNINVGLLDYPVLQAADILVYKAEVVPVGEDQIQHIEFSREVARKFNAAFGRTFPEPQAHIGKHKRLMGLDGKSKMSKSLNNYIGVLDDEATLWRKLKTAFTDESRIRKSDPGDPEICNIFTLHEAFSGTEETGEIGSGCRAGTIGCVDCKKRLHGNLGNHLTPIREKAGKLRRNPQEVWDVLERGASDCRKIARKVMDEVREKSGLR